MKSQFIALLASGFVSFGAWAAANVPATQPADNSALEIRAVESFNRGEYTIALPLLQKLKTRLADQPDKLGPVEERIRVAQRNLLATLPKTPPKDPPTSSEQRKPHAPPREGETRVLKIKELGNFDYDQDKGGNIPSDVERLNGATVRLTGFMIPMDQADKITRFALVPDLFACCFGQPPQIQHSVTVVCPKGKAVSYFQDEIAVEGKLSVGEKKEDGFILSIFEVEALSVKPAAK